MEGMIAQGVMARWFALCLFFLYNFRRWDSEDNIRWRLIRHVVANKVSEPPWCSTTTKLA
jgi:hypothetical protein